jgi:hypothetical protein
MAPAPKQLDAAPGQAQGQPQQSQPYQAPRPQHPGEGQ